MKQVISTPSQLGELLRSARRAAGITQEHAAPRLGLSQSRLSALELGPKTMSAEQLLALLGLYGLELVIQSRPPASDSHTSEW